jgi:hypothetical protein
MRSSLPFQLEIAKKIPAMAPICMLLVVTGIAAALVTIQGRGQRATAEWVTDAGGHPVQVQPMLFPQHRTMELHRKRNQTTSESYNWSGYAVTGAQGSVSDVKASWVVPTATCSSTPPPPSQGPYASFWVGIDGWTSNSVEQIGTDSDCVNAADTQGNTPTYYAWFEFYPQGAYFIGNPNTNFADKPMAPGDSISAEVKATGTCGGSPRHHNGGSGVQFTVSIADVSKGWNFNTTSCVNAQQTSAEWIAETPYGCSTRTRYCILTNFGAADYGDEYTLPADTSSATISGKTGSISSFGTSVQQTIMVSDPAGVEMAAPSALADNDTDGDSNFIVTYVSPGP